MAQSGPVEVKDAVKIATEYLETFQDLIPVRNVRLEETEYDDSGDWLITLSTVDDSADTLGNLAATLGVGRRSYKVFRIDAATGKVKSMKVRAIQPAE